MATTVFDDLLSQAKQAEQTLRSTLAGFTAEKQPHLSDLGRRQFQDRAKEDYTRTVADLRTRYQAALESESAKTQKALAEAKAADVERRRSTLGDATMARIYERRLASMDADQLRQALAEATQGYEAALIRELGSVLLTERLAAGGDAATHRAALEYAQPATPELTALRDRQRDLVIAERNQEKLDPIAWKADTAVRLGVSVQHLEMPNG